jgi:hypothetical protein
MSLILSNLFRFLFLLGLQVLLLNNVALYNIAVPYPYVLFIILLPLDIPVFWLYFFSFMMGLGVDIFANTPGFHTSACVIMALCRITTLNFMNTRNSSEFETTPTIKNMGFNRFLTYAAILIFIHHLSFYIIDIFRFSEFFYILLKVLASSLFTLLLVILTQYIFFSQRTK